MSFAQISVLAAVVFAIVSPIAQAVFGIGLTASQFSQAGDATLRAAGYAFSIWSVIYAGLIAYALYQAAPRQRSAPALRSLSWPAVAAIFGTGLWIWASALNERWASVLIIVISAIGLTWALSRVSRAAPETKLRGHILAWWPLCLLAGWLTIASVLNILTVLTAEHLIEAGSRVFAIGGLAVALAVVLVVLGRPRLWPYGLPPAWGLVGVYVAERDAKPDVASIALACAVVIAASSAWQGMVFWRRQSRG
ncbi:hypothetical protein CFHF_06050 [Caulobacter flavus]|uniref:Tryptophan-rich sensory protein n=1 Tax=Caulobacter flavus TaxID=1679497 RepID=A0A2N5CX35_9CAUL|nr:hypothetical protein [Caulobacter flavus]AYV47475.1 hypothetical protein C1707_15055 [Caulobacter flavus]PLR18316.1 hypothetical protein CFHF_06050 [Caulobacter flavus]